MRNISFMLMADTYKNTNPDALPKGLTKLTSYILRYFSVTGVCKKELIIPALIYSFYYSIFDTYLCLIFN